MNMDALKYFVAVAKYKSISKAAQELFITQPALSRNLKRLEEELGVTLFERSRGSDLCQITEIGAACLLDAEQALAHMEHITAITKKVDLGEHGTLTISFTGYEESWLLEWIRQIKSHYPGITFQYKQLNWQEMSRGLLDRSIDIAIFDSSLTCPGDEHFRYLEIIETKLQIIVSKEHPFAERPYVTIDDLKDQPFIGYKREISSASWDAFYSLCMQHGFAPNYIALYESTKMILSDIYCNRGISFYLFTGQKMVDRNKFALLDVKLDANDIWPKSYLSFVYHKDNNSACLKNVIKLVPGFLASEFE